MTVAITVLIVVLVPPILGTQTRAYDTVAQSCAGAIQASLLTGENGRGLQGLLEQEGVRAACAHPTLHVTALPQPSSFSVQDSRGRRTYVVTPTALSSTP